MKRERIAIVGAGIVGLSHAWCAAERGHEVTVFERSSGACGASVRNFGMIWPVGQPAGELSEIAIKSRNRWLRLADESGLWVNPCGSLHLAHRDDEWQVLQQFVQLRQQPVASGQGLRLLTPHEVSRMAPAANPHGLRGAMYSPAECCVNPREALQTLAEWLAERFDVQFQFNTHIANVNSDGDAGTPIRVSAARGYSTSVHRAIICCGAEMQSLFPSVLEQSGLVRCKLQMLSIAAPSLAWSIGPHLASGLTLRHYRSFDACPGSQALRKRISEETPELDRFGVHVMASQNNHGQIILGDSHEYGSKITPFDSSEIDGLILRELQKILVLPDWSVSERWHGVYVRHPSKPVVEMMPLPNVHLVTGTGGAGMTMSFGLAEEMWNRWSPVSA